MDYVHLFFVEFYTRRWVIRIRIIDAILYPWPRDFYLFLPEDNNEIIFHTHILALALIYSELLLSIKIFSLYMKHLRGRNRIYTTQFHRSPLSLMYNSEAI